MIMQFGQRIFNTFRVVWRRATSRTGLATEVSAALPVLNVLESQISDAMQKATGATDDLSRSFGDMAMRAREVVEQATGAGQGESQAGVDEVRKVVSVLLTQVRKTNDSTEHIAEMLGTIESDLQDVEACMSQIEEIANSSRMVSLNGQIEAARAGVHGLGFAVVATETGDLATTVTETSQRIRTVVDRLTSTLGSTSQKTRQLVSADKKATAECEEQVGGMLTSLAEYQRELELNLDSTKSSNDQLATAIQQSVMTLQFQDAVSQRMNHVSETMGEIRETFGTFVSPANSGTAKRRTDEWLEKLAATYCVDEERRVLYGEAAETSEPTTSSNIELF